MTPLPQRKKTAEEIAKLRDQLGVPASVESDEALESTQAPSELEAAAAPPDPPDKAITRPTPTDLEQAKASTGENSTSKLPIRRRSAEELEEMRRRDMLSQMNVPPPANPKFMAAHPALIAVGYLLAAIDACSFWIEAYPLPVIITTSVAALLIAAFLFLRRPISRHHAGFISAIAVLVGVFATIHHLPQLQHAS